MMPEVPATHQGGEWRASVPRPAAPVSPDGLADFLSCLEDLLAANPETPAGKAPKAPHPQDPLLPAVPLPHVFHRIPAAGASSDLAAAPPSRDRAPLLSPDPAAGAGSAGNVLEPAAEPLPALAETTSLISGSGAHAAPDNTTAPASLNLTEVADAPTGPEPAASPLPAEPVSTLEFTPPVFNGELNELSFEVATPEMGRVEIRLALNQSDASAYFGSDNSGIRDLLLANLDRLQLALESSGLQLIRANVGDRSPRHSPGGGGGRAPATVSYPAEEPPSRPTGGLVDAFA